MYFMRDKVMCTQQAHQTKNFDGKKWQFFVIFDNFLKIRHDIENHVYRFYNALKTKKKQKMWHHRPKILFFPRKKILILQHLVKW